MNGHSSFLLVALTLVACGGQTIPTNADAGDDAAPPVNQCHGYCPQPNGSSCSSDCDCYNKCLFGTDKPARCADPIAPSIACGDAAACPSGQKCGPFGTCEGASCTTTNECPIEQQCLSGACAASGCI